MITQIWQNIKKGQIAPVYLLVGEETYFIDETIRRLKETLFTEQETEITTFDLAEQPLDFVMDEGDTFPFFCERKLIIVKNSTFLKATEKGKEKINHNIDRFLAWLKNPPETAVTVFIAPYERLDERKKVTKQMKEQAVVVVAQPLQERELYEWLTAEAKSYQKDITNEARSKLIAMTGTNMLQLQMEIEKIALYLGEERQITVEHIEQLVAKTLEHDAFQMLEAYLKNDQATALLIYHDLLRQKEEPIMLTGLLASNIRMMSQVFYLVKKGYHPQQIAKQLKVHPYRVKLLLEQKNRPSEQRLLQALHDLAQVDVQLKTSSSNRERILELFLMKRLK